MKRKTKSDLIQCKLEEIHRDLKEVRQVDIPQIKVDVAVVKSESKSNAKIISTIGGILAVAVSTAIAWIK